MVRCTREGSASFFGSFPSHGYEETTKCKKLLGKIREVILLSYDFKLSHIKAIFGIEEMFASHQSK